MRRKRLDLDPADVKARLELLRDRRRANDPEWVPALLELEREVLPPLDDAPLSSLFNEAEELRHDIMALSTAARTAAAVFASLHRGDPERPYRWSMGSDIGYQPYSHLQSTWRYSTSGMLWAVGGREALVTKHPEWWAVRHARAEDLVRAMENVCECEGDPEGLVERTREKLLAQAEASYPPPLQATRVELVRDDTPRLLMARARAGAQALLHGRWGHRPGESRHHRMISELRRHVRYEDDLSTRRRKRSPRYRYLPLYEVWKDLEHAHVVWWHLCAETPPADVITKILWRYRAP